MPSNNKLKLVAAFDGAGLRGIIPLIVLHHIDESLGEKFTDNNLTYKGLNNYIDVFTGVSSGALAAAFLAGEATTSTTHDPIQKAIDYIDKNREGFFVSKTFGGVFSSMYDTTSLRGTVTNACPNKTFGELDKKLLLTSGNLKTSGTTYWTNMGDETSRKTQDGFVYNIDKYKIADAVKASSAVHPFVEAYGIQYQSKGYEDPKEIKYEIDGGVSSQTTVLQAVAMLNALEKVDFKDMFVLSLGSGTQHVDLSHLHDAGSSKCMTYTPDILINLFSCKKDNDNLLAQNLVEANNGKFYKVDFELEDEGQLGAFDCSVEMRNRNYERVEDYIDENTDFLQGLVDNLFSFICAKEGLSV